MHPREERAREQALAAFEALCPGVAGNPWIPHWPHPKQAQFLGLHLRFPRTDGPFEALYGGAAGGGKSDALLMGAAQIAWLYPGSASVCFRRSYAELAKPGAIMDRAMQWWLPAGVDWSGTNKLFTFPNGSRVQMAYHGTARDEQQFQSAEFQYVAWDELTHWEDDRAYREVSLSRMRQPAGWNVPLRVLSGSNPGGPGHTWVKMRFMGGVDPNTGHRVQPVALYLPATIDDNPSLDREPYKQSLMRLHPTRRDQLLGGDWSAREPGDYFRSEWFGPLLDPVLDEIPRGQCVSIRWWDLAASEKENACRTAGVRMARLRSGVRAVQHAVAFRLTPGARDAAIVRQAQLDGRTVTVGIEIEPGSGGVAQFDALAKRLRAEGFRVVGARPRVAQSTTETEDRLITLAPSSVHGKEGRADPVASCLERGYQRRGEGNRKDESWWGADAGKGFQEQRDGIRLYTGAWTQEFLDEIEGFPEATLVDLVDAFSGAWAWLEAHPLGSHLPTTEEKRAPAELQDVHPEERPDASFDVTRPGTRVRWRQ